MTKSAFGRSCQNIPKNKNKKQRQMKICGKGSRGPLCIVKASNKRRRYVAVYVCTKLPIR